MILGNTDGMLRRPGCICIWTQEVHDLAFTVSGIDDNKEIVECQPGFVSHKICIRNMEVGTIVPGILYDQFLARIVITGHKLIMSEPRDLAGIILFVIALFGNEGEASRQQ